MYDDLVAACPGLDECRGRSHQASEVSLLELQHQFAELNAGDVEQLRDQSVQALRLLRDDVQQPSLNVGLERWLTVEPTAPELCGSQKAGEGRLQLVCRYNQELIAQTDRGLRFGSSVLFAGQHLSNLQPRAAQQLDQLAGHFRGVGLNQRQRLNDRIGIKRACLDRLRAMQLCHALDDGQRFQEAVGSKSKALVSRWSVHPPVSQRPVMRLDQLAEGGGELQVHGRLLLRALVTAQRCAYARDQRACADRLLQIIIRSQLEAPGFDALGSAAGEHQNGHLAAFSEFVEQLQTTPRAQPYIQQYDIRSVTLEALHCCRGAERCHRRETRQVKTQAKYLD